GILRHALHGVLPESIANRASKADFTSSVNEGVARDYDLLAQCLQARGIATAMGYVERGQLQNLSRSMLANETSSCELSWALGDLLSLELWLQEFFGPTSAPARMEVC